MCVTICEQLINLFNRKALHINDGNDLLIFLTHSLGQRQKCEDSEEIEVWWMEWGVSWGEKWLKERLECGCRRILKNVCFMKTFIGMFGY